MTQTDTNNMAKARSETEAIRPHVVRDEAPHDPALPGLQSLLSVEHMSAHLATHLGLPVESIASCDISYVRYKPGTNCLVAYRITTSDAAEDILSYGKVYTEKDFDRARAKEDSHRWVQAPGLPESLILNKERAIVYFFPNDCLLEGLRVLSDTKKLQRLLYDWFDTYPESEWRISDRKMRITPVRYKPERRAVLRCDTRATHREKGTREPVTVYVRIYSDGRGESNFGLMEKFYEQARDKGGLSLPRPLGYLPSRSLLMMEGLPGASFKEAQAEGESERLYSRLGAALWEFHALTAPQLQKRSAKEIMAETFSSAESLAKLVPELVAPVIVLKSHLKELTPAGSDDMFGLVHGDFHQGQAVISDAHIGIIDFDRSYTGDQYADLGELCAHVRLSGLSGENGPFRNDESAFLSGYESASGAALDRRRLIFWTTLRMLSLSVTPFRRLELHWRATAQEIVKECSKLLVEK